MANISYWGPDDNTQTTADLSKNGHYLRLGTYDGSVEPGSANIKDSDGNAQGIYFWTTGKYTMKVAYNVYQEIAKDVTRTIQSGNYDYTNSTGTYDITLSDGGVHIESENKISIKSDHITSEKAPGELYTSITFQANDHDLYFQQAGYAKYVDERKESTTEGITHKTNIGVVVKIYGAAGLQNYSSFGLSVCGGTIGAKVAEASTSGVSFALYGIKNSLVFMSKWGLTLVPSQIVWLHEEYCVFKNEFKFHRFETKFNETEAKLAELVQASIDSEDEVASMEAEAVEVQG